MSRQEQSHDGGDLRAEQAAPDGNPPEDITDAAAQPDGAPHGMDFASLLDSLRTIDDTFHFKIESGPQAGALVPLEGSIEDLPVGLDSARQNICFGGADLCVPCAVLRKDWEGVSIAPHGKANIQINGEAAYAPRLLKHGDRVELCVKTRRGVGTPTLAFHVPVSLRVLPSLSSQLARPHPAPAQVVVTPDVGAQEGGEANAVKDDDAVAPSKIYFGLFKPLDVLLILLFTLAGAGLVFFLLDWLNRNV